MTKVHPLTREDYKKLMQGPPFNYSGYLLERAMKSYDDTEEFTVIHPHALPSNMKQVSFTGYSDESIDDNIEMRCDCGSKFVISGGHLTICPGCGRMYRVINYIAQYEKK